MENRLAGLDDEISSLEELFPDEVNEEKQILKEVKVLWEKIKGLVEKVFEVSRPIGNRHAASIMEEIDYEFTYPALQRLNR